MKKKKFHNIEALHAERLKLEEVCKEKEAELGEHLQYIQQNFGSLVVGSILPFTPEQRETVSGIMETINGFIGKILGGEDSKLHQSLKPLLKIIQMVVAGFVYKSLKKVLAK